MPILTPAVMPLIGFVSAVVTMPLAKGIARRFGMCAAPVTETGDLEPTPLTGGVSIIGAILIAMAIGRALPPWILMGTAALFAIGLVDDAHVLRTRWTLMPQVVVVLIVVAMGPPIQLAPWPLIDAGFAGFYLLSVVNAFDLIDGLDGLAGGVGIFTAAAVAAISLLHGDSLVAFQALIVAGALAGFLIYNLHPASICMGASGALPLGLLLGTMALHAGNLAGNSRLLHYFIPILIMLVPLLDAAIVTLSRIAMGTPILRHGLDHPVHRLLSLGLSDQRVVGLVWGLSAATAACAVLLTCLPHQYQLATFPMIVSGFGLIGLFMIDLSLDVNLRGVSYDRLKRPARFILNFGYKRPLTQAALDLALIPAAYFSAFLIRLDFQIKDPLITGLISSLLVVMPATYASFLVAGVYGGMWRYASVSDVSRFANGSVLAGILVVLTSLAVPIELSGSIAVLYAIMLLNLLVASRMSFRVLRRGVGLLALTDERVLIVGAGELAEAAARYLTLSQGPRLKLVGFVDDDSFRHGKLIHGQRVIGTLAELEKIFKTRRFSQVLVATGAIANERLEQLRQFADGHKLSVRQFSIRLDDLEPSEELDGAAAEQENPILVGGAAVSEHGVV